MTMLPEDGQPVKGPVILPVRTYRRRVLITFESWTGCSRQEYLYVDCIIDDSEAVIIGKAANEFRRQMGYADRIVSVDVHPQ